MLKKFRDSKFEDFYTEFLFIMLEFEEKKRYNLT